MGTLGVIKKGIYPELALYGSKNECARTDTVFFPISQVCTRGVTLNEDTVVRKAPAAPALLKMAPSKAGRAGLKDQRNSREGWTTPYGHVSQSRMEILTSRDTYIWI